MGCYSSYISDEEKETTANMKTSMARLYTSKNVFYENLNSFSLFGSKKIALAVKILLTNLRIQKCDYDCTEESPFIIMDRPTFELSLFLTYLHNLEYCISEAKSLNRNKEGNSTRMQAKHQKLVCRLQKEFKAIKKTVKDAIKKEL